MNRPAFSLLVVCTAVAVSCGGASGEQREATTILPEGAKESAVTLQCPSGQMARFFAGENSAAGGSWKCAGVGDAAAPASVEIDPFDGVRGVNLGPHEARMLVDALPLEMADIDFGRIERFIALFLPIAVSLPPERRLPIGASVRLARQAMRGAQERMSVPGRSTYATYNVRPLDVANWLKPPSGSNVVPALTSLQRVVQHTRDIIHSLYSLCGRHGADCGLDDSHAGRLQSQAFDVGGRNIDDLQNIISRIAEQR